MHSGGRSAMSDERSGVGEPEGQRQDVDALSVGRGRRPRRRVVVVSEVDQRLIERGLPPSWEERVSDHDRADVPSQSDSNDARLMENVPPHAQPRI